MTDPILDAFDSLARRASDRPLLIGPAGAVRVGEIDDASRLLAGRLAGSGGDIERPVALAAPSGAAFLAGLAGIRRAGRPVLLVDCGLPAPERLRHAERFGAGLLLAPRSDSLDSLFDGSIEPVASAGDQRTSGVPPPTGTGYIKLSSGSTGAPRGILFSPESLAADEAALFATMGLRPTDRILATIPFSHSYGLSSIALPALVRGLTLVHPELSQGGDPFSPIAWAREHAATVFPTTPAWLHAIARLANGPAWPESLRVVISAGAPLQPGTAARMRERFHVRVHAFYGASECGGICFDRSGEAAESGGVGEAIEGVRLTLVPIEASDDEQDEARDHADDQPGLEGAGASPPPPGLVRVESDAVATAYFPADPQRLSEGVFTSSDLARLEGTGLVLCGRADDMIIVRGKNVRPGELERVLEEMDGVEEAVALGVTRPGGGDPILRAVIACPPGRLTREQVVDWCRSRLAEHKLPRSIIFARSIPRTARGKVNTSLLASWDAGADPPTGS